MKRNFSVLMAVGMAAGSLLAAPPQAPKTPEYVLIGWNNLGMHGSNPTYDELVRAQCL